VRILSLYGRGGSIISTLELLIFSNSPIPNQLKIVHYERKDKNSAIGGSLVGLIPLLS